MRILGLRETKCLPTTMLIANGEVRSQIQVSQDSKIHACAPSVVPHHRVSVLSAASSLGLMEI